MMCVIKYLQDGRLVSEMLLSDITHVETDGKMVCLLKFQQDVNVLLPSNKRTWFKWDTSTFLYSVDDLFVFNFNLNKCSNLFLFPADFFVLG